MIETAIVLMASFFAGIFVSLMGIHGTLNRIASALELRNRLEASQQPEGKPR